MSDTSTAPAYVGRRRQAPQCQFGLDGCTKNGVEIELPDEHTYDGVNPIGVACPNCESKLYRD